MTDEQKKWIDSADYESLLRHWRNAPSGDPIFQGEAGEYYKTVLARKRDDVGNATHVAASKSIGWEG